MKRTIIIIVSFILVVGVCLGFFFFNYSDSEKIQDNEKIEYNNIEENKEIIIDDSDENKIIEEETNDNEIVDNTDVVEDNNNSVNTNKEENKTITQSSTQNSPNNSNSSNKEEPKEESKPVEKQEEKKEESKQETISNVWDELGISEYDYYNKPMWSWARIDFSINDYKTYEKTREACISKGEEYFEQGYGYSCTGINSYSGDYLGEMLKTF